MSDAVFDIILTLKKYFKFFFKPKLRKQGSGIISASNDFLRISKFSYL